MKHAYLWFVGSLAALAVMFTFVTTGHAVKVEKVVSPRGVEAWLVRDHSIPITAIEFTFRSGAAQIRKERPDYQAWFRPYLTRGRAI